MTPGLGGIITTGIDNSSAIETPWSAPAPPNATKAKSLGSYPLAIDNSLTAFAIFELATLIMDSAASCGSILKGSATVFLTACSANSLSSVISPPARLLPSRPSTTLASLLVAIVFPLA